MLQAWLLWKEGKTFHLVDPALRDSLNENEVTRSIHIGLLCVQKDIDERPTMASVVHMLNSSSMTLPIPYTPAFFLHDEMMPVPKNLPDSVLWTANGVSFSELYPR
ncbi:hypothetical protein LIER_29831 [Lithospermum erythrorhizon]|uniref:Uncharacterized protein n=1 Tax=Lithospermum erythrorhizon TaxID=34254 RepID=A0AAV3RMB1_LITER